MKFLKSLFSSFLNFFKPNKVEEKPTVFYEEQLEERTIIHQIAEKTPTPEEDTSWVDRWIPDPTPNFVGGIFTLPSIDPKLIDPLEPVVLIHYNERTPARLKLHNGNHIHRIWRAPGNKNMQPIDKTSKAKKFIWVEELKQQCTYKRAQEREKKLLKTK